MIFRVRFLLGRIFSGMGDPAIPNRLIGVEVDQSTCLVKDSNILRAAQSTPQQIEDAGLDLGTIEGTGFG